MCDSDAHLSGAQGTKLGRATSTFHIVDDVSLMAPHPAVDPQPHSPPARPPPFSRRAVVPDNWVTSGHSKCNQGPGWRAGR